MSAVHSLTIPSRRRRRLAARLHGSLSTRPVVIIAHGMLSHKSSPRHRMSAAMLEQQDIAVVRFDFAGRGRSEGDSRDITPYGECDDLLGVIDFVAQRTAGPIGLLGSSLGGAIALMAASMDERIRVLAAWAAVGDFECLPMWSHPAFVAGWRKTGQAQLEGHILDVAFLQQAERINLGAVAKKLRIPVLLAHGTQDEVVPIDSVRQLAQHLAFGTFVPVAGADHRLSDLELRAVIMQRLTAFLGQQLGAHE